MKNKIDIILPVYKEQDNIERVLEGIKKYVKVPSTVNLVFHSKADPTIPVVKKILKSYKNVKMFVSPKKGLISQFTYGFKKTTSPIIVIMMSDLSDDPKDIDKMIKKINEGYDLVCASRYIEKGKRRGGSKLKAFLSYAGCESLYMFTGLKSHDATNAFKAFRRNLLKDIVIESSVGYEMPLELIIKAHLKGYKIAEIPTIWTERDTGYSKFKLLRYIPNYLRWYLHGVRRHILRF